VTRRLLVLIGGSLAFWILVALPARAAWGDSAVVYSATALALCLVPAAFTLAWATWAAKQPADKQLTMVLGGTGVRLFGVAIGAVALIQWVPYFRQYETPGFWAYLAVFYLFTLILETILTVAGRPAADRDILPTGATRPAERVG
jgi:heme/copper-type cytochrome/quinol oxidase subunit 3